MSAPAISPPPAPRVPGPSARPPVLGTRDFGGLLVQGAPSLRLPGEHFAAALLFLGAGSVGLVWIAPELAAGLYLSPHVAGVTHCFTLGWLTMTIFGALYQLLPVALGVSIRSERLGHVSFWSFAPGVALFASGVATESLALRHVGIVLVAIGIVCLVINVALSLRRIPVRDVIWAAVAISLTFLSLTLVLGVVLVHNLHTGFLGDWRVRVLATHLHVALIGWVLMMIVGISHRLLPMFLLAHGTDTRWTHRALTLLAAGVVSLAIGIPADREFLHVMLSWSGLILIEGGVVCFLIQATWFYVARKRPRLDAGLRHAAVALAFLTVSAALAPVVMASGVGHQRLDTAYVVLGLLGGLVIYAVGQFYKVVPFLAWMSRFRNDMGKKRVPTVADLYSPLVAHIDLALFAVAITGLAVGVATGVAAVVRVAAMLYVVGVALFISQMTRVAFGTSFGVASMTPMNSSSATH